MNLPTPVLIITDGTETVDLIAPTRGWHLTGWEPSYPNEDIGYRQSPMASGRAPITRRYDYPVEEMVYVLDFDNQDIFIAGRRKLDRLLTKALDYWKDDWRTEPVWLEVRGTYETDKRYAVVVSSKIGPYPYPFGGSMVPPNGASAQDALSLSIEHTFWQDELPGASHCIEASAQTYATKVGVFKPTEQDDDCYVDTAGVGAITLNSAGIRFGEAAASMYHAGVRFRAVTIPQGARILAAYVYYMAENNLNANTVAIHIHGHDADAAAIFTTYADFMARVLTTAYGDMAAWGAHVAGTAYQTIDVMTVVQEIVDRAGWASGNPLALIFENQAATTAAAYRDMSSFDSANAEPELHVVYEDTSTLIGRSATCLAEVYVANKHNDADITHIYTCTAAGAFGANLKVAALPYDLLEGGAAGPANGDFTYFGSECVNTNPRPFCSLVFDIGTAATYGVGDSVAWQYWNGAIWITFLAGGYAFDLSTGQDQPWDETGICIAVWNQPLDWITTTVNGIGGFWIRCVVTEATGITRARQQNRQVYSIVTSFRNVAVTTAAGLDQLRGDLPLPVYLFEGGGEHTLVYPNRVLFGIRSVERSNDFRAYINLSNRQNGPGVNTTGSLATSNLAATGQAVTYTFAAAITTWTTISSVELPLCDYHGRFHLLVRYFVTAGTSGDMRLRFRPTFELSGYTKSVPLIVIASPAVSIADLGRIEYPASISGTITETYLGQLQVEQTVAAARTVNLIDFILIPADEWIGDFNMAAGVGGNYYLQIDSVTKAKRMLDVRNYYAVAPVVSFPAIAFASQPLTLIPAKQQRLWYFMNGSVYPGQPVIALEGSLDAAARYLNMRGDD